MMARPDHENHHGGDNVSPEDIEGAHVDARLREVFSSWPTSAASVDFEHRVLAKVQRRKFFIRSAFAASMFFLLTAVWQFNPSGRYQVQDGRHQAQSVVEDPTPAAFLGDVELFASAYQGTLSPVVHLEKLESEQQALLSFLSSLEAAQEN